MEHGATIQRIMEHQRAVRRTALIRASVGTAVLVTWALMATTGIILAVGPWDDVEDLVARSRAAFLGMNQAAWGGIHMGIAYVAVVATLVHIGLGWRAFRGYFQHLTSRRAAPAAPPRRSAPAGPPAPPRVDPAAPEA